MAKQENKLDYLQRLYKEKIGPLEEFEEEEINTKIVRIGNSQGAIIDKKVLQKLNLGVGDIATIAIYEKGNKEGEMWDERIRELISKGNFTRDETMNFFFYLEFTTGVPKGREMKVHDASYQKKMEIDYQKIKRYLDKYLTNLNFGMDDKFADVYIKLRGQGISDLEFTEFTEKLVLWMTGGKKKDLLDYFQDKKVWKKKLELISKVKQNVAEE